MFIQTQTTPNPHTLRFVPPHAVMGARPGVEFTSPEAAAASPLAARLLAIEGISRVFFGADFISVTKNAGEWAHLKPLLLTTLMEHFVSKAPLLLEEAAPQKEEEEEDQEEEDDEQASFVRALREVLGTHVRPAVARDGGDVTFVRFAQGIVYLEMRGACSGCPSSAVTLKQGIETLLRHYFPQVREVRDVSEAPPPHPPQTDS